MFLSLYLGNLKHLVKLGKDCGRGKSQCCLDAAFFIEKLKGLCTTSSAPNSSQTISAVKILDLHSTGGQKQVQMNNSFAVKLLEF